MKEKILVVDDEAAIKKALTKFLTSQEYDVDSASDGAEAVELAKNKIYDLVITDLKMPNMTGIELITELKKINPQTVTLVMTGFGTIDSAVEAIKAGAFHYFTKPFELDDVAMLIDKALKYSRLEDQNQRLRRQVSMRYQFENIVGCSEKLKEVFDVVQKVADTDSTVLVTGESGTGKELIARAIHFNSKRAQNSLVAVNCAAIPENLLETELFGYVKGAFTGAVNSKIGKFEQAQGGTVFLDEVGDMSMKLQVKLLRVLQERKLEPVGSTQTIDIDVRIIAATQHHLEELVEQGLFREDLYYRLNVIDVPVPALRDRVSDIPLLLNHFMTMYAAANQVKRPVLSEEVINLFMSYKWPGNVRELENTIERLVVLKPGQQIAIDELPDKFSKLTNAQFLKPGFSIPEGGISLKNVVEDFENTLIEKALAKTNWNKNRAASLLKLNRTTLVEKIKKKNLIKP
ncbi:MAG TPA: sigma-54 dependent transcriptional regulator, partial [bacterium]|nr:sigma-54 dependent transcriptional regulator [bacterium]